MITKTTKKPLKKAPENKYEKRFLTINTEILYYLNHGRRLQDFVASWKKDDIFDKLSPLEQKYVRELLYLAEDITDKLKNTSSMLNKYHEEIL